MWVPDYTLYRHLSVKPPAPAIGQKVIVAKPGGPEEEWKPCRSGIADSTRSESGRSRRVRLPWRASC